MGTLREESRGGSMNFYRTIKNALLYAFFFGVLTGLFGFVEIIDRAMPVK